MPHRDKILVALCLAAFAPCAALLVGELVRAGVIFACWGEGPGVGESLIAFASAIGGVAAVGLSHANDHGRVTAGAVAGCVAGLCVALLGGFLWVALQLYPPAPIETAPFLFAPIIALLAWRGWRVAGRGTARVFGRDLPRGPMS